MICMVTFFSVITFAQNLVPVRKCGTMNVLERLKTEDPALEVKMEKMERELQKYLTSNQISRDAQAVVTIPVVVHVVYNTSTQNISDAQIQSQIKILNDDFRRLNADKVNTPSAFSSVAADCQINFCLASKDPSGNATTGITRTSTSTTSFYDDDKVKSSSTGGKTGWSSSSYLNIWVCNLGGGLLGYAQFPGGSSSTDGVVIGHKYFGNTGTATAPFNKGRTTTHEVGHWLNLYHIWGDAYCGNDNVSDTPTQQADNYGCPSYPHKTCGNTSSGDMFMNYMDYTDDACMNMFSTGQSSRMNAAINNYRSGLLTSTGCGTGTTTTCNVPSGLTSSSITSSSATLAWSSTGAVSYSIQYRKTSTTTWTSTTSTSTSKSISGLSASTQYEFQVKSVCTSSSSAFSSSAYFTTTAATSGSCSDVYEPNESLSAAKSISTSTSYYPYICSATDVDWFKFSNSSTYKNIKVTLSYLPYDYDLYLYNSSGTLLKKSENGGTTSEKVIYNYAPVGTYYIKVVGYNGAYSTSTKYKMIAYRSSSAYSSRTAEDSNPFDNNLENFSDLKVYPNPANEKITTNFFFEQETQLHAKIMDVTGREVINTTINTIQGDNYVEFSLFNLVNGVYSIHLFNKDEKVTRKFVVIK